MSKMELKPGNVWSECLCAEIHLDDRPCIVCEVWIGHEETPPPEVKAFLGKVPPEKDKFPVQ